MSSVNKAVLLGRLGADPEVRTFENGEKVANFSLATSEQWKDKDRNKKEATEWHKVAVFGKKAEIAEQYLKKGSLVYLEGQIKTRSYDSNGETKYITEVVIPKFGGDLTMLGSRSSDNETEPDKLPWEK